MDLVVVELDEALDGLQSPSALTIVGDVVEWVKLALCLHVVDPDLLESDGEVAEDREVVLN